MTRESPTRRKSCGLTFLEEGGGGGLALSLVVSVTHSPTP